MSTEPRGPGKSASNAPRRAPGGLGADASRGMTQASRGHAAAFGFVGAVLLFFGAGRALDSWLGTGPWLQVVGSIAGWVLGVVVVYYASQRSLD